MLIRPVIAAPTRFGADDSGNIAWWGDTGMKISRRLTRLLLQMIGLGHHTAGARPAVDRAIGQLKARVGPQTHLHMRPCLVQVDDDARDPFLGTGAGIDIGLPQLGHQQVPAAKM
jgi:hypothetical protein